MSDLSEILQALTLHPGDTLVLRVSDELDHKRLHEFVDEVHRVLGDNGVKAIVVRAEELAVIRGGQGG